MSQSTPYHVNSIAESPMSQSTPYHVNSIALRALSTKKYAPSCHPVMGTMILSHRHPNHQSTTYRHDAECLQTHSSNEWILLFEAVPTISGTASTVLCWIRAI